jgi:ferredoxin-nitrite reductase
LGVQPQKQSGYFYIGFPVPLGWLSGDQMLRVADVVDSVGGDIRLTRQQNFIVGNVPESKVAWVVHQIEKIGFPLRINRIWGRSIACTGEPFCNYSVTETKTKLKEIIERLEAKFGDAIADLKIHLDGCPHACGQHWVGDIGLQGTTARETDEQGSKIQAYDVILRGGLGRKTAIGKQILRRIPTDLVQLYLERLIEAWLWFRIIRNGNGANYTFRDFCDERTDEELIAIAEGKLTVRDLLLKIAPELAMAC